MDIWPLPRERPFWRYYDFDTNWDEFWRVWNSDEVQDVLEHSMDAWCENEAPIGSSWKRGDSLWRLSRTDYWDTCIRQAVEAKIEDDRMLESYRKMMRAKGWPCAGLPMTLWKSLYDELSPKHGTLASLILVGGKNYVSEALYAAAESLFPGHTVHYFGSDCQAQDDEILIVDPGGSHGIVFDLYGYYFQKEGDAIVERKYDNLMLSYDFGTDDETDSTYETDYETTDYWEGD